MILDTISAHLPSPEADDVVLPMARSLRGPLPGLSCGAPLLCPTPLAPTHRLDRENRGECWPGLRAHRQEATERVLGDRKLRGSYPFATP